MRAILTVDMDNAAFEGESAGPELGRILDRVAAELTDGWFSTEDARPLFDVNGNRVGELQIED